MKICEQACSTLVQNVTLLSERIRSESFTAVAAVAVKLELLLNRDVSNTPAKFLYHPLQSICNNCCEKTASVAMHRINVHF
jgi:hypothetical protein